MLFPFSFALPRLVNFRTYGHVITIFICVVVVGGGVVLFVCLFNDFSMLCVVYCLLHCYYSILFRQYYYFPARNTVLTTQSTSLVRFFFHGALRPQKPYGLLGTGEE